MAAAAWSAMVRSQSMQSGPTAPRANTASTPSTSPAVDQRLAAEPGHPLGPHPVRVGDPVGRVGQQVEGLDRLAGRRDPPDLPHPEREAAERPIQPGPFDLRVDGRPAAAGDQVQAGRAVPALGRHHAAGAVLGPLHQPDPGQGDARGLGQPVDDQAEQIRQRMLPGHVQEQPLGIGEEWAWRVPRS